MTDKTCAERISSHAQSREEDLAALFQILEDGEGEYEGEDFDEEDARTRLIEFPLSVDTIRTLRILLSTGGPGDWLDVELDWDGNVAQVEYNFNDWFDHASIPVKEGTALWRYAEWIADWESL